MKQRCTATTQAGTPCKAWAVPQTDPPLCAAHGGTAKSPGAPHGNQNALKHGFYSASSGLGAIVPDIEAVIADLFARQMSLTNYIIKSEEDSISLEKLIPVFTLHAQTASRLGRLLRDRRALTGEAADGIAGAIAQALDELSIELGTQL